MRRFTVNGTNVYEVTYKDSKVIDKLIDAGYIVIYNRMIVEGQHGMLVSKNNVSLLEHYRTIKDIYPHAYVSKNFIEIGYKLIK